jgi:glutamate-1-semialdehyde 2,1-aminomutase
MEGSIFADVCSAGHGVKMPSSKRSGILSEKARSVTVGGVHDELRYTDPYTLFFKRSKGSKVYDIDGKMYTDFLLGYGPLVLGHCHPKVVQAVQKAAAVSDLWGIGTTEMEYKLAEKITRHIPSAEKVRFCNAGSDATFHALRLSRAFTGRRKILKFEGSYHGWHDYVDISVMPPADKVGTPWPVSAGILPEAMAQTIVVPWNDVGALERAISQYKDELAAVITEPILHNIGVVMPKEGYLQRIREVTEQNGIVFILDEVITAFRHSLGGAQKLFGIKPDLTTFAKAMANGYPIGGLAGRADIMNRLKPLGDVHMAATYYSHPISVAASLATIDVLEKGRVYEHMDAIGEIIEKGLKQLIKDFKLRAQVRRFHSIFTLYFTDAELVNYASVLSNDAETYNKYCASMREQGIILSPHHLKRCHLSAAHTKADANKFLTSAKKALEEIRQQ